MRSLLPLACCVLLGAPALHAQDARVHRLASAPLAVTLPGAFQTGQEADVGPGVAVQVFTALGDGTSPDPNTTVIVETHRDLSRIKRLLYRHGVGLGRAMPTFEIERVRLEELGLSESLAASATSAFLVRRADGRSVGVVVRGCADDVCYAVAAQGPRRAEAPSGAAYAALLAGVEVGD